MEGERGGRERGGGKREREERGGRERERGKRERGGGRGREREVRVGGGGGVVSTGRTGCGASMNGVEENVGLLLVTDMMGYIYVFTFLSEEKFVSRQ